MGGEHAWSPAEGSPAALYEQQQIDTVQGHQAEDGP